MKIERLYTLSQFVDWFNDYTHHFSELEVLYFINEYNDFLKQPLKKEMFMNEVEKPTLRGNDEISQRYYDVEFREWQQAEKKVIFEGVEIICDSFLIEPYVSIPFYEGNDKCIVYETLLNLSEATTGQLKLKNIEL